MDSNSNILKNVTHIQEICSETVNSLYHLSQTEISSSLKGELQRNMLVMSCSSLEAIIKQVVYECLEIIIATNDEAAALFKTFVTKMLKKDQEKLEYITNAILAESPKKEMIKVLERNLTANSLQSVQELSRVASHFGIQTGQIIENMEKTQRIFARRNEIIHEFDIIKKEDKLYRTEINEVELHDYIVIIINISKKFVNEIKKKLDL